MKQLISILLLFNLQSGIINLPLKAQTNTTGSFVYKGNPRDYIVHLPPSPGSNLPLVFNLHGYGQTATAHQFYTQFDAVADTSAFIVVYPNAVGGVWDTVYPNSPIDDAGFISALIDTLADNYSIDITRVYSTGLSMGGYMTYRLACELNDRIAAVASVAGPMPNSMLLYCDPVPTTPVMHIHGTADATVSYQGDLFYASVDSLIQYWVQKNNCLASPDSFQFPDINTADSCTVTKYHYGFCDDSTEVLLYKILNGGHTWPGTFPFPSLGNTNQDIKAGVEIWNFFQKHQLDTATVGINKYSIPENRDNQLKVYPNPNNGIFTIELYKPLSPIRLKMYDILGRTLIEKEYIDSRTDIDLSWHPKGVYHLQVVSSNLLFNARIIIE